MLQRIIIVSIILNVLQLVMYAGLRDDKINLEKNNLLKEDKIEELEKQKKQSSNQSKLLNGSDNYRYETEMLKKTYDELMSRFQQYASQIENHTSLMFDEIIQTYKSEQSKRRFMCFKEKYMDIWKDKFTPKYKEKGV